MTLENWLLFSSIAFVATISPGPAILLVSTHSAAFGARNAVATMSGNITGLLIMSALSVLGLSTLILYSTPVFMTVKFIGAAYLIYLGVRLWRYGFVSLHFSSDKSGNPQITPSFFRRYRQGLFVALSNPKAIAFTTALFPQFIQHNEPVFPQFTILVATFMSFSFVCLLGYAYLVDNARKRATTFKFPKLISKLFGSAFIASGLFLASASQKQG